jgi:preprotein translocase subunit SecG
MNAVLTVLHVLVCIFLIAVVLLQRGKGAEMGAVFGGGASSTVFGSRGAGNFLTLLTKICAMAFMITSGWLSYLYTQQAGEGLFEGGVETYQEEPFEQLGTVMPEDTDLGTPQADPLDTAGDDAVFAEPAAEDAGASDGSP